MVGYSTDLPTFSFPTSKHLLEFGPNLSMADLLLHCHLCWYLLQQKVGIQYLLKDFYKISFEVNPDSAKSQCNIFVFIYMRILIFEM